MGKERDRGVCMIRECESERKRVWEKESVKERESERERVRE